MRHILAIFTVLSLVLLSPTQNVGYARNSPVQTTTNQSVIPLGNLVIGIPEEDIESTANAGSISVLFSQIPAGPDAGNDQAWHQDSPDVAGAAETGDEFGSSLASGDFNGDGLQDLAIGVPYEDIDDFIDAGAVQILYADSPVSFTAAGNWLVNQNATGMEGVAEAGDKFGASLAVGDFNDDTYDDLAIGVPGEEIDGVPGAGMVNVIYGSTSGLSTVDNEIWYQGKSYLIQGTVEADDKFGFALTSGDFNGDTADDLAVGVPGDSIFTGSVNVIYGSRGTGLIYSGNEQVEYPGGSLLDYYGWSLTHGDFNGDGYDDLAIGAPWQDYLVPESGQVQIIAGSKNGLSDIIMRILGQDENKPGMDIKEIGDGFGYSLAAADFDGNGKDDLAIGVPFESISSFKGSIYQAGMVNIAYFDSDFSILKYQALSQSILGWDPIWAEADDQFGRSLAAGDLRGDGIGDLVIGIPYEDIALQDAGNQENAGIVALYYGEPHIGLGASQIWSQDGGVLGVPETGDKFGEAVTISYQFVPVSRTFLPMVNKY